MENSIMQIKSSDYFFRDATIILSSNILLFGINFLFHVFMSRMLGPVEYGMMAVIFSIFYLVGAFTSTITYSLTKFFAQFSAREDRPAIFTLFLKAIKKINFIGLVVFLICFSGAKFLGDFLKFTSILPFIWLGGFLWSSFLFQVVVSFLSGLQKFLPLAFIQIFSGVSKLILGIILVILGFGLNGAIASLFGASVLAFLLGILWFLPYLKEKKISLDAKAIYQYSLPVFVTNVCLTFFINIDIILVKHLFNNIEAGYYAAGSTLAKIIYFGSVSIITVMFPKVADKKELQKGTKILLFKALAYFFLGTFLVLFFFYFFPDFTTKIVFGERYILRHLLFPMGRMVALFSLASILALYLLAVSEKYFYLFLIFFAGAEVFLIWGWHHSLIKIINNISFLMIFLIIYLGYFVLKTERKNALT